MPLPVDDKFILETESKLGLKLPNSYKARVRGNNGGDIRAMDDVRQLFPVFDTSDRRHIVKTSGHILRETQVAREWPGFPSKAVPFASNGTGNYLLFLPSDGDPSRLGERVFYWDHETSEVECIAEDMADLVSGRGDEPSDN